LAQVKGGYYKMAYPTLSTNKTTFHSDNPVANAAMQDPTIKAILQGIIDTAIVKNEIYSPVGEPSSTGPTSAPIIDIGDNKLKSNKIGYFNLLIEYGDYVTSGKYIVYRDVFAFTEQLKLLTG